MIIDYVCSSRFRGGQRTTNRTVGYGTSMLSLHHVNLGVPPGGKDAEASFLVDFLGYRRVGLTQGTTSTATWFESDDGKQIHLSEDEHHQPAARAHVAVELGENLREVELSFERAAYPFDVSDGDDRRTVLCCDPAGNRWELRGAVPSDGG